MAKLKTRIEERKAEQARYRANRCAYPRCQRQRGKGHELCDRCRSNFDAKDRLDDWRDYVRERDSRAMGRQIVADPEIRRRREDAEDSTKAHAVARTGRVVGYRDNDCDGGDCDDDTDADSDGDGPDNDCDGGKATSEDFAKPETPAADPVPDAIVGDCDDSDGDGYAADQDCDGSNDDDDSDDTTWSDPEAETAAPAVVVTESVPSKPGAEPGTPPTTEDTTMAATKKLIICADCGEEKTSKAKGLCAQCYDRQRNAKRGKRKPAAKKPSPAEVAQLRTHNIKLEARVAELEAEACVLELLAGLGRALREAAHNGVEPQGSEHSPSWLRDLMAGNAELEKLVEDIQREVAPLYGLSVGELPTRRLLGLLLHGYIDLAASYGMRPDSPTDIVGHAQHAAWILHKLGVDTSGPTEDLEEAGKALVERVRAMEAVTPKGDSYLEELGRVLQEAAESGKAPEGSVADSDTAAIWLQDLMADYLKVTVELREMAQPMIDLREARALVSKAAGGEDESPGLFEGLGMLIDELAAKELLLCDIDEALTGGMGEREGLKAIAWEVNKTAVSLSSDVVKLQGILRKANAGEGPDPTVLEGVRWLIQEGAMLRELIGAIHETINGGEGHVTSLPGMVENLERIVGMVENLERIVGENTRLRAERNAVQTKLAHYPGELIAFFRRMAASVGHQGDDCGRVAEDIESELGLVWTGTEHKVRPSWPGAAQAPKPLPGLEVTVKVDGVEVSLVAKRTS